MAWPIKRAGAAAAALFTLACVAVRVSDAEPPAGSAMPPDEELERSGLGNIVHVDVAFPFDGDPSIKNVQFLIETKRRF